MQNFKSEYKCKFQMTLCFKNMYHQKQCHQIERSMRAAKLNCTLCFISGNEKYVFDKVRKIPLLSEVFDEVKNDDLVMYLLVS